MANQTGQSGPPIAQAVNGAATFLTADEAAELLRVSVVTLARWRGQGLGPPARWFGRRVVYALSDLLEWAEAQKASSTSEHQAR